MFRDAGLLTVDFLEIIPIKIEGKSFPALLAKPYDMHSFKIFDCKTFDDKLCRHLSSNELNEEIAMKYLIDIVPDVQKLVDNSFSVGSDSINLALTKDKKLRLFINDVGSRGDISKRNNFTQNEKKEHAKFYLKKAIDGFAFNFPLALNKKSYIYKLQNGNAAEALMENLYKIMSL